MPGKANTIFMSCALSQDPNQPFEPKTSTKISPPITGDTAKGRSINVIRNPLPRKRNLVTAQAAITPNRVFSGTVIAATSRVSRRAEAASGSVSAARKTSQPRFSASVSTTISGSAISQNSTSPAAATSTHFTAEDSVVAGEAALRCGRGAAIGTVPAMILPPKSFVSISFTELLRQNSLRKHTLKVLWSINCPVHNCISCN
ncbi:hypothetical protein D3C75_624230 [compost metagenome]